MQPLMLAPTPPPMSLGSPLIAEPCKCGIPDVVSRRQAYIIQGMGALVGGGHPAPLSSWGILGPTVLACHRNPLCGRLGAEEGPGNRPRVSGQGRGCPQALLAQRPPAAHGPAATRPRADGEHIPCRITGSVRAGCGGTPHRAASFPRGHSCSCEGGCLSPTSSQTSGCCAQPGSAWACAQPWLPGMSIWKF